MLGHAADEDAVAQLGPVLDELAGEAEGTSEAILRHRDGSEIPVRAEVREIRAGDGTILYRETRFSDLREASGPHIVLPLGLRGSDYERVFEHIPLPAWISDRDTLAILAVNEAAAAAYGYTSDEFRALTVREIRAGEGPPEFEWSPERTDGDEFHAIDRHRRKDGSVFVAEVFSRRLDFGGRPARLVISCDITRRWNAQELLRRSSEELRTLSERLSRLRDEETRIAPDGPRGGDIAAEAPFGEGAGDAGAAPHERLSAREARVFLALAAGRTMTSVARELGVSVQTVSTYRSRIFEKMGLHSREDLVRYAARHGLIE